MSHWQWLKADERHWVGWNAMENIGDMNANNKQVSELISQARGQQPIQFKSEINLLEVLILIFVVPGFIFLFGLSIMLLLSGERSLSIVIIAISIAVGYVCRLSIEHLVYRAPLILNQEGIKYKYWERFAMHGFLYWNDIKTVSINRDRNGDFINFELKPIFRSIKKSKVAYSLCSNFVVNPIRLKDDAQLIYDTLVAMHQMHEKDESHLSEQERALYINKTYGMMARDGRKNLIFILIVITAMLFAIKTCIVMGQYSYAPTKNNTSQQKTFYP